MQCLRIYTKKILKIAFFLCICWNNAFAEEPGNGFLGIEVAGVWQRYDTSGKAYDFFKIPISFIAASSYYEIIANLSISPELLHLDQYYTGKSRLPTGPLQPFSFANLEVQHMIAEWKIFHVNAGFKIGHYGYLNNSGVFPLYTLFVGFKGSIYTFLGNHFMIQLPLEIPAGIYNHNLSEFFTLISGLEITFDPMGPIINPVTTTTLFSLGFNYTYLRILSVDNVLREMHYMDTFIKISLLY